MNDKHKILLTGATGYVGKKLLKELEGQGHEINCLTRNPDSLRMVGGNTHVFQGDVLERSSMWRAFHEVDTAYFMVHMLHERDHFEIKEIKAAENFALMARGAGVKRIIYLGALGNEADDLSAHLRSRQDVGHILRKSGIPTVELRSSIVLGKGSLSFDLIKDLTEHLPLMVTPKWVSTPAQPIGIGDLLNYLIQSLDVDIQNHETVEVGGANRMSYGELMRVYARQRGLNRLMLPVPVLSPRLSSRWIAFFTRVDPILGRKLIEGIRNPSVVENNRAFELFDIQPMRAEEAMAKALAENPQDVNLKGLEHVYAA